VGYDYIRIPGSLSFVEQKRRVTEDTAILPRRQKNWVEEFVGIIVSWKDLEGYPWPKLESFGYSNYEFVLKDLSEGMKMLICPSSGVFEITSEPLLGFERDELSLLRELCFSKGGVGGI